MTILTKTRKASSLRINAWKKVAQSTKIFNHLMDVI